MAGAAAFYALYAAISAKGRKRRRRRQDGPGEPHSDQSLTENFTYYWDLMFAGRINAINSLHWAIIEESGFFLRFYRRKK